MASALFDLSLALADDALVLGHRLSEWSSRAPTLEEDIALSNLGLDLIGQARLFYALAGALEGQGRDEDQLAYFRDAVDYRCLGLVQLPRGDFAFTMARQLAFAAFMEAYFDLMRRSTEPRLAEIAAKAVKEMAYHVRHAAEWVIRLGDGTAESRRRLQQGLADVWPYTGELFEMSESERQLVTAGIAPDRTALRDGWTKMMSRVLREAGLDMPTAVGSFTGGRVGAHTPHLAPMLAEMQSLARAHPGATW
ncbi:MAG: 1,2-phenylacetyl-CoA epoxidase subunit PaaC [Hyphomicrobiaceae bacterium]